MFARFNVDVSNTKTVFSSVKSKSSSFSSQMADTGYRLMERFRYTRLQFITNLAEKWRRMIFSGWPNIIQIHVDKVELVLSHPGCGTLMTSCCWLVVNRTDNLIFRSSRIEIVNNTETNGAVFASSSWHAASPALSPSLTDWSRFHSQHWTTSGGMSEVRRALLQQQLLNNDHRS